MIKISTYKYINLLFRVIIGFGALFFIYKKLNDGLVNNLNQIDLRSFNYIILGATVFLMFVNWGLEAIKWKYAVNKIVDCGFVKAFKIIFTGILTGLITPNRIGEIPTRAWLLSRNKFKQLLSKTIATSYSQALITLLVGIIALGLINKHLELAINSNLVYGFGVIVSLLMLYIYFDPKLGVKLLHSLPYFKRKEIGKALLEFSRKDLSIMLLLSMLRYIVFCSQYYLLLKAFGVNLIGFNQILLIPICFLFTSIVPTILISEVVVRTSVAIVIFGTVSNEHYSILLASITLWVINVALPAIIGLTNLKHLKLLKEY